MNMQRLLIGAITLFAISTLSTSFHFSERQVSWETPTLHDFGTIAQDQPVTFNFVFRNITDGPILIENVRPTCGCTAPEWKYDPIEADSTGVIEIEYDAKKAGYFNKPIKVFFYGQRKVEKLSIEGFVE